MLRFLILLGLLCIDWYCETGHSDQFCSTPVVCAQSPGGSAVKRTNRQRGLSSERCKADSGDGEAASDPPTCPLQERLEPVPADTRRIIPLEPYDLWVMSARQPIRLGALAGTLCSWLNSTTQHPRAGAVRPTSACSPLLVALLQ